MGLPASAIDAQPAGSSQTYTSRLDQREELLQALRPWSETIAQGITQALSTDRRGLSASWDIEPYTRADTGARMTAWEVGIRSGVLTVDEARAREPYATGDRP